MDSLSLLTMYNWLLMLNILWGLVYSPNHNDTNTLIPFVQQLERLHTQCFKYVVADTRYDSHEYLTWLKHNQYLSCIKPQYYERQKTKV
ncbi:MAG: transposase [Veillonella sp.]|nr:transposase [Veillonella sp.]